MPEELSYAEQVRLSHINATRAQMVAVTDRLNDAARQSFDAEAAKQELMKNHGNLIVRAKIESNYGNCFPVTIGEAEILHKAGHKVTDVTDVLNHYGGVREIIRASDDIASKYSTLKGVAVTGSPEDSERVKMFAYAVNAHKRARNHSS